MSRKTEDGKYVATCRTHPKYTAKRPPTRNCRGCWGVWFVTQSHYNEECKYLTVLYNTKEDEGYD